MPHIRGPVLRPIAGRGRVCAGQPDRTLRRWRWLPPAGERLREIGAPALVVVGANDTPATLKRADEIASKIPEAMKVVIPGAAHMVNMDAAAPFNAAALEFFATVVAAQ